MTVKQIWLSSALKNPEKTFFLELKETEKDEHYFNLLFTYFAKSKDFQKAKPV